MAVRAYRAAAAVGVLACVTPARGDDQPPNIDAATVTADPARDDDAAIRDGAEQVQRALGGSVVDHFPTLQRTADAPIVAPSASPRRMFRRRPDSTTSRTSDPLQSVASSLPQDQASWSTAPVPPLMVDAPAAFPMAAPTSSPVNVLRAAAAELEASANRLEQLELYRNADALRALAQELRLDARKLVNRRSSGDESFAPSTYRTSTSDPPRTGWPMPGTDVTQ